MAKAQGKVILLGEHAVVFGIPAVAAGLDRGASARARPDTNAQIWIDGEPLSDQLGLLAYRALTEALGAPAARVDVELELPAGAGLGASAAIGVATARALLALMGKPQVSTAVRAGATAWERIFHGTPSGIDVAAAMHGGCIRFDKQRGGEPIELARPLELALAIAGPPASTKRMVEAVAQLKQSRPVWFESVLDGIAGLSEAAVHALQAGKLAKLGELMNENHRFLQALSVSTRELDRACAVARDAGALGAKLTGAGGGGAVVALSDGHAEPILAAWRKAGFAAFVSCAGRGPSNERPT